MPESLFSAEFIVACLAVGAVGFVLRSIFWPQKCSTASLVGNIQLGGFYDAKKLGKHTTKILPAGKKRIIHVNRRAIVANLRHELDFPTAIVVEDGKSTEYHGVFIKGPAFLEFDRSGAGSGIDAQTYLTTTFELLVITKTNSPSNYDQTKVDYIEKHPAYQDPNKPKVIDLDPAVVKHYNAFDEYNRTALKAEIGTLVLKYNTTLCPCQKCVIKRTIKNDNAVEIIPLPSVVNFHKQTRTVIESVYMGCARGHENVEKQIPLKQGEEGYVNAQRQVKTVRTRGGMLVEIPLSIGDPHYNGGIAYQPFPTLINFEKQRKIVFGGELPLTEKDEGHVNHVLQTKNVRRLSDGKIVTVKLQPGEFHYNPQMVQKPLPPHINFEKQVKYLTDSLGRTFQTSINPYEVGFIDVTQQVKFVEMINGDKFGIPLEPGDPFYKEKAEA